MNSTRASHPARHTGLARKAQYLTRNGFFGSYGDTKIESARRATRAWIAREQARLHRGSNYIVQFYSGWYTDIFSQQLGTSDRSSDFRERSRYLDGFSRGFH